MAKRFGKLKARLIALEKAVAGLLAGTKPRRAAKARKAKKAKTAVAKKRKAKVRKAVRRKSVSKRAAKPAKAKVEKTVAKSFARKTPARKTAPAPIMASTPKPVRRVSVPLASADVSAPPLL